MDPEMRQERPQKAADGRNGDGPGHGAKTGALRDRAILALLSERTLELAAARAGVGERTLRRWLTEDQAFKADYEAARRAAVDTGLSRIHALTARAVETLEDLLEERRPPAVRLGAARTVVEIAMHQRDAETILQRLEAIEAVHNPRRP